MVFGFLIRRNWRRAATIRHAPLQPNATIGTSLACLHCSPFVRSCQPTQRNHHLLLNHRPHGLARLVSLLLNHLPHPNGLAHLAPLRNRLPHPCRLAHCRSPVCILVLTKAKNSREGKSR